MPDGYEIQEIESNQFSQMEVEVTRNEALFLDDSFTLMIEPESPEMHGRIGSLRPVQQTAAIPVPMDLLEKVGRAIIFTNKSENKGKTYTMTVDYPELYMIREVASSFIKVGEETVGYNLKIKVAKLLFGDDLRQETQDRIVNTMLSDIEGLDIPDPVPETEETDNE